MLEVAAGFLQCAGAPLHHYCVSQHVYIMITWKLWDVHRLPVWLDCEALPISPFCVRFNASPGQAYKMLSLLSALKSAALVCYLLKAHVSLCAVCWKACTHFPQVHVVYWCASPAVHKYRVVLHFHGYARDRYLMHGLMISHAPVLHVWFLTDVFRTAVWACWPDPPLMKPKHWGDYGLFVFISSLWCTWGNIVNVQRMNSACVLSST